MHSWNITTSNAIVVCLLLMVLGEVASRQLIVATRYLKVRNLVAKPRAASWTLPEVDETSVPAVGHE